MSAGLSHLCAECTPRAVGGSNLVVLRKPFSRFPLDSGQKSLRKNFLVLLVLAASPSWSIIIIVDTNSSSSYAQAAGYCSNGKGSPFRSGREGRGRFVPYASCSV